MIDGTVILYKIYKIRMFLTSGPINRLSLDWSRGANEGINGWNMQPSHIPPQKKIALKWNKMRTEAMGFALLTLQVVFHDVDTSGTAGQAHPYG